MSPKTICIDGFNLSMQNGTGIATYARNLNDSLREMGYVTQILYGPLQADGRDSILNEIGLADGLLQRSPHRLQRVMRAAVRLTPSFHRVARPVAHSGEVDTRQVRHQLPLCDDRWTSRDIFHKANHAYAISGLFTELRFTEGDMAAPDVMHWTCALPIHAKKAANLYTIHDLVPIRLPFATLENKRRFVKLCRKLCDTAERIVTVSERSKSDIIRIFGIDEARVNVTYQSVAMPEALTSLPDEMVAATIDGLFGLDWRGYFIFFGASEPKKNLARIVEAYLSSGVRTPLVVVSGRGWLEDDVSRLLDDHVLTVGAPPEGGGRAGPRIRRYQHLPFDILVSLIRGAKATLLPSLYEGFGLPVLESMLLKTPVLTSTAGALPEVAGEAALLVDPYDTAAIRNGIRTLDADADLRADLIERGVRQAARFSPENYKVRLAELYSSIS